jgi:hypothetical protein
MNWKAFFEKLPPYHIVKEYTLQFVRLIIIALIFLALGYLLLDVLFILF